MALYRRGQVWWMRLTYQGQEVRRSTEVTDKRLAERIYHKLLGQIAEGKWFERLPGDEKTVEDLLERYLRDHSASNKAPSTYRRDQSLAAHLIHAFGDRPLTTVRPAMIAEYKAQRRDYGAAPKTINDEIKLLSHAFKLAMKEWEWVTVNPVDRVSREKVYNQIERWLSLDEEQRLLAASPRWLQEIIVFAIHTGLRQGEILNLQWPQIDLFRRTMVLLEQKNRCKDTLPLNDSAMDVLKARARERSTETDYVFFNQVGKRRDATSGLRRAFYPAMRKAKIERFRFHDLRHTFATRLVQAGVDIYTVQKLGRWKTISMVMRYAHHYPESLRGGVEVLDRIRPEIRTIFAQSAYQGSAEISQPLELIGAPGPT